jgi:hypothetical protein
MTQAPLLLPCTGVAAVDHWVKTSLSTAAGAAPNFLQALFGVTINADTGPLLFSAALATAVWLFNGFATACIAHPNHWLRDMRTLVLAVGPWLLYGARLLTDTLISSFAGLKGDPLVSYGFKQMYSGGWVCCAVLCLYVLAIAQILCTSNSSIQVKQSQQIAQCHIRHMPAAANIGICCS